MVVYEKSLAETLRVKKFVLIVYVNTLFSGNKPNVPEDMIASFSVGGDCISARLLN